MNRSDRDYSAIEDNFSLTVDHHGHLWLHTKLEGLEVAIDLAPRDIAFQIMAAAMVEHDFELSPVHGHDDADNDDDERV